MTQETPIRKSGLRNGQIAFLTIGLVGLLFFAGMELLKRRLHSTPPAPVSSVVIPPAKVLGPADMNYLTDAVPGTLSTLLAQVEGLETKVPPGSMEVERIQGDLKQIAGAYRVSAALTSVIAMDGNDLTLDLQVVNPETHSVLWSNQYLGKRTNYNELLRQAADGAGQALQPGSTRVKSTAGLAASSDAELAYREGEYGLSRFNNLHDSTGFEVAAAAFKKALQLDPSLANAAAGIGQLYAFQIAAGEPVETALPDVEKWGNEALRIDPRNGRGYNLLGEAARYRGDNLGAVRYGLKAVSAAPMDPQAQSALDSIGFASESLFMAVRRESQRLDPFYLYPQLNEAPHSGQMQEALTLIKAGKMQAALNVLVQESVSGFNQPYDFLMLSPLLASLRSETKFQPVLARSRAKFEELAAVLEDARVHGQLPGYLETSLAELLVKLGMKKAS